MNGFAEMLQSTGVLAEACKMNYDAFVRAGFTKAESLELAKEYMRIVLSPHVGRTNAESAEQ